MGKVNHSNFKIWYDAGNIIYYTGKDPIEQLKPIAQHVTGFCAKDCAGVKGEIWLDFGKGKVDFPAVFKLLKESGFNGPVMVECCDKGKSLADITAGAKRNREKLLSWFAEL
jgi:sugar phosphate isomerase/epimerase